MTKSKKPPSTPEEYDEAYQRIFKMHEYEAFTRIRKAGLEVIQTMLSVAKTIPGVNGQKRAVEMLSAMFCGLSTLAGSVEEAIVHVSVGTLDLDTISDKQKKQVDEIRESLRQSFGVYRVHGLREHVLFVKRAQKK